MISDLRRQNGVSEMIYKPLTLILVVLAVPAFMPQPAWGLEDGRIGVLYIGCITRSPPFWYMRSDPMFSINFVLATLRTGWASRGFIQQAETESAVARMVRLYMPRTYKDLTSRFDVIILCNANRDAVGPLNIEMLARGVREGGMSLLMDGGFETFGSTMGIPWGGTAIGELLPTDDVIDAYIRSGSLILDRRDNEFISSLPWETKPIFTRIFYHNLIIAKTGSVTLAHVDCPNEDHPAMVTWQLESGSRTFSWAGEIHKACLEVAGGGLWEYCIDLGCNLIIYLDGRPVPQDIDLIHRVRSEMLQIATRRSMLLSLVEFCEDFGANTNGIMLKIDQADNAMLEATPPYLELRLEDALESYQKVGNMLTEIEQDAINLKKRALLWVYLIEWLAVTGTSMICGFALWTIMVRRRLYREIQTTRLSQF